MLADSPSWGVVYPHPSAPFGLHVPTVLPRVDCGITAVNYSDINIINTPRFVILKNIYKLYKFFFFVFLEYGYINENLQYRELRYNIIDFCILSVLLQFFGFFCLFFDFCYAVQTGHCKLTLVVLNVYLKSTVSQPYRCCAKPYTGSGL